MAPQQEPPVELLPPPEASPAPPPPGTAHGLVHGHTTLPSFRFLDELKRRNVGRIAILYIGIAYVTLEIFELFFHLLEMPAWTGRASVLLAIIGFPVALTIAWAYEITPDGLKPTDDVPAKKSIAAQTGRRLDRAIIVVLAIALSYFVVDKFWLSRHTAPQVTGEAAVAQADVKEHVAPAAPLPATAVPEKSVAVLPFIDMSEKHDQEYFSDGLSEELIDMLVKVPDLRVPARTSSFYFKGKQATIKDIAATLGVAHVLEGSVRKSGNSLRITAQLIRVDNGYHLWSKTFDRKLDDIFKVQDDIAGAVVNALQVSLLQGGRPNPKGTQSSEAYNLYLQATYIARNAVTTADQEKVVAFLQRAVTIDPAYAAAWSQQSSWLDDLGRTKQARAAAERGLELDPNLPLAHTNMARVIFTDDFDLIAGGKYLQQALQLDPKDSYTMAWLGQLAIYRGDFGKAIDLNTRATQLDPANPYRYGDLYRAYFYAGRYTEAAAADRRMRDLKPQALGKHYDASQILLAKGDAAGALAELDRESDATIRLGCGCRTLMLDALGRKAEADASLRKLELTRANEDAYGIGRVYAERGDLDQAFAWLERAYRQRDSDLPFVKVDPLMKNIQKDPRFHDLLIKLQLA